jgi:hypothetical protein
MHTKPILILSALIAIPLMSEHSTAASPQLGGGGAPLWIKPGTNPPLIYSPSSSTFDVLGNVVEYTPASERCKFPMPGDTCVAAFRDTDLASEQTARGGFKVSVILAEGEVADIANIYGYDIPAKVVPSGNLANALPAMSGSLWFGALPAGRPYVASIHNSASASIKIIRENGLYAAYLVGTAVQARHITYAVGGNATGFFSAIVTPNFVPTIPAVEGQRAEFQFNFSLSPEYFYIQLNGPSELPYADAIELRGAPELRNTQIIYTPILEMKHSVSCLSGPCAPASTSSVQFHPLKSL